MSEQTFKNLGKFISYEEKDIGKGFIVVKISYTQPRYQDPLKVWVVGKPEKDMSEELLEKIAGLKDGEEICVHTEKNEKGYNELVNITDKSDVPAAVVGKSAYKKHWAGGSSYVKDETGIAVGAAYTNALEVLKLHGDTFDNYDDIITVLADLAEKILNKKLLLEDKLRAKKAAKEAVGVKKTVEEVKPVVEAPKTLSKLEEMRKKKAAATPEPDDVDLVDDEEICFDD